MILKLTAIACVLVALGFGMTAALRRSLPPQDYVKDKSVVSLSRRAKNEGKTQVSMPGKIIDYPGMNMGLDEALQNYSVVIAELVESKSYISESADEIATAYKLRIVESLSQRNAVSCNGCSPVKDVSDKLQPAQYNEFMLNLSGGSVTVDGVEVSMISDRTLKIEDGQRYLMFISFTPGGMARLIGGPSGLFRITHDESLEAMSDGTHRLAREIAARFSRNLSKFKQAAKR
ncbi:MAG TPA: hypothetical protein VNG71_07325 [Pyrinomonadaceae bacterium]|nr:hypothetical protein [Pyrinomonadaceae bacterium]